MFRGSATVNLDEKGRFAMPTRFRGDLKKEDDARGQLVVTVGVDAYCVGIQGCLWIYPAEAWGKVEETIDNLDQRNPVAVSLKRLLIGYATDCEMDGQGRILLPENLRNFAGLGKKFMLVGQLKRLEVWSEEAWSAQTSQFMVENNPEDLEKLGKISF